MAERFHIKGFIPVSMLDWPGRISCVVFLGGCGFRCPACHNSKLVLEPESMPDLSLERVLEYLEGRISWIDGVAVTGGEPTLRRNLPDLLHIFRSYGLAIKLDTNGSNPPMIERLLAEGLVDAIAMDVKAPLTRQDYSAVAGVQVDPRTIAQSIGILRSSGIEITFRTTVIPGLVEEPELARIRECLGHVSRYVIQPFRNLDTLDPSFALLEPFSARRFEEMQGMFEIPRLGESTSLWHASAG
jgi:pyruvate formate lyase activating enzyme